MNRILLGTVMGVALLLAAPFSGVWAAPGQPAATPPPGVSAAPVLDALQDQLRTLEQARDQLRDPDRDRVSAMIEEVRGDLDRIREQQRDRLRDRDPDADRDRDRLREQDREHLQAVLSTALQNAERHRERLQAMLADAPQAARHALQLAVAACERVRTLAMAQQRGLMSGEPGESQGERAEGRSSMRAGKGTPHPGGMGGGMGGGSRGGTSGPGGRGMGR